MTRTEQFRSSLLARGTRLVDRIPPIVMWCRPLLAPRPGLSVEDLILPEETDSTLLLSAADIPGHRTIRTAGEPIPVLAEGPALWPGQAIALLLSRNPDALRRIIATTGFRNPAGSVHSPGLDASTGPERVLEVELGTEPELARSSEVEGIYRCGGQAPLYDDPPAAFATTNQDGVRVLVDGQWPQRTRRAVAEVLGVRVEQVQTEGLLAEPSMEAKFWQSDLVAAWAALGARATGLPTVCLPDQLESFRLFGGRAPAEIRIVTALSADGEPITSLVDMTLQCGAIQTFGEQGLLRCRDMLAAGYRMGAVRLRMSVERSAAAPTGSMTGGPEAALAFAMETHIGRLAVVGRKPALTVRRSMHGAGLPAAQRDAVADSVLRLSDFERKWAAREALRRRGGSSASTWPRRGIGFAQGHRQVPPAGEAGGTAGVVARLLSASELDLRVGIQAASAATRDWWRDLAASVMEMDREGVSVIQDAAVDSGPASGGRAIGALPRMITSALRSLQRRRFREPLPLEARGGSRKNPDLPLAACVVDTEFIPVEQELRVREVWIALACGRILDRRRAEQRVEQEVFLGLGHALTELRFPDRAPDRQTLENYIPAVLFQLPRIRVQFLEDPRDPLPVTGLAMQVVPAAVVNAASQAGGVFLDRIPATPSLLLEYRALGA